MAKVKFIKDHPSGFKKDAEADFVYDHALRLAREGYVEFTEGADKANANKDLPGNPLNVDTNNADVVEVTEEMLEENEELKDAGISAGDKIYVAKAEDKIANPLNVDEANAVPFKVTKKSLTENPTWEGLNIKIRDVILVEKK